MTGFNDAARYVHYKLANATDAELAFFGMGAKQRDLLLAKEIITKPITDGIDLKNDWCAYFSPLESRAENASVIHYSTYLDKDRSLEAAAHEIFHAAQLWSQKPIWRTAKIAYMGLLGFGCSETLAGAANRSSFLLQAGLLSLGASLPLKIVLDRHNTGREIEAHRFGFLFHPRLNNGGGCIYDDEETKQEKLVYFLRGYPTKACLRKLYLDTAQDCLATQHIRNYGLGFNSWLKKQKKTGTIPPPI